MNVTMNHDAFCRLWFMGEPDPVLDEGLNHRHPEPLQLCEILLTVMVPGNQENLPRQRVHQVTPPSIDIDAPVREGEVPEMEDGVIMSDLVPPPFGHGPINIRRAVAVRRDVLMPEMMVAGIPIVRHNRFLEPTAGIEPATSCLRNKHSTIELRRQVAGQEGIEPSFTDLEAVVLPLHY